MNGLREEAQCCCYCRSWWKFAEEAGEEPTAPGTISVDEAGAISVSDTPGSMGGVPGLEAVAAPGEKLPGSAAADGACGAAVENHVQAAEAIELLEVVQMAAGSTGAVPVVVVTSNVNVETQKLQTDSGTAAPHCSAWLTLLVQVLRRSCRFLAMRSCCWRL